MLFFLWSNQRTRLKQAKSEGCFLPLRFFWSFWLSCGCWQHFILCSWKKLLGSKTKLLSSKATLTTYRQLLILINFQFSFLYLWDIFPTKCNCLNKNSPYTMRELVWHTLFIHYDLKVLSNKWFEFSLWINDFEAFVIL